MNKGVAASIAGWRVFINAGDRLCADVELESLVRGARASVDVIDGDRLEPHAGQSVLRSPARPDRCRPGSWFARDASTASDTAPSPRPSCSSGAVSVAVRRHASLIIRSFSTLAAWAGVLGAATIVVPAAAAASSPLFAGVAHPGLRARACGERPTVAELDALKWSSRTAPREARPRPVAQIVGEGP